MWGLVRRGVRLYECSTNNRMGAAACKAYGVKESEVLPFVLETLKSELGLAQMQLLQPKPKKPFEPIAGQLEILKSRDAELAGMIEQTKTNLALAKSPEVFKMLQDTVAGWIEERNRVGAQIAAASEVDDFAMIQYTQQHVAWLKEQEKRLLKVWQAAPGEAAIKTQFVRKSRTGVLLTSRYILWEIATLRGQLQELGARVELFWRPEAWGKRTVYRLDPDHAVRVQLGQFDRQQSGRLCEVPAEERCNGTRGADRPDSRTGRD